MLALGLVAPTHQPRDRSAGIIAEFDFTAIADTTAYPFRLQLEQYKYVRILLGRPRELPNVDLRYDSVVESVTAGPRGVTVTVRGGARGSLLARQAQATRDR